MKAHESIRKRPAMYVGDTDESGMRHVVCEVISNSMDQVLLGYATRVEVTLERDGRTVTVADDGAGVPFDVQHEQRQDENQATFYLTNIHFKPTADDHAPHIHLHLLHGCGAVVANTLSATFHCESWRDGRLWAQSFVCGVPAGPARVIEQGDGRGTTTKFLLDETVFGDARIDVAEFRQFLREKATLFQGLDLRFNEESLIAPRGLVDLIQDKRLGEGDAVFHMNEAFDDMSIQAVATGHREDKTYWRTWVNACPLPQGGSHKSGFEAALRTARWEPAVAMIHLVMSDPKFAGPVKNELVAPEFEASIAERIEEKLIEFRGSTM